MQLRPLPCRFLKKGEKSLIFKKTAPSHTCFSRTKRLQKRFLTFTLLLNCQLPLKLSRLRHNSCYPRLKADVGSLIFLKNCPSFTFFKKSMQPASKIERECGAAGKIRPRIRQKGAADLIERVIPAADQVVRNIRTKSVRVRPSSPGKGPPDIYPSP